MKILNIIEWKRCEKRGNLIERAFFVAHLRGTPVKVKKRKHEPFVRLGSNKVMSLLGGWKSVAANETGGKSGLADIFYSSLSLSLSPFFCSQKFNADKLARKRSRKKEREMKISESRALNVSSLANQLVVLWWISDAWLSYPNTESIHVPCSFCRRRVRAYIYIYMCIHTHTHTCI